MVRNPTARILWIFKGLRVFRILLVLLFKEQISPPVNRRSKFQYQKFVNDSSLACLPAARLGMTSVVSGSFSLSFRTTHGVVRDQPTYPVRISNPRFSVVRNLAARILWVLKDNYTLAVILVLLFKEQISPPVNRRSKFRIVISPNDSSPRCLRQPGSE